MSADAAMEVCGLTNDERMPRRFLALLGTLGLLAGALSGCANDNPDQLPGFFDLQYQITSFYHDRAQENGATCNLPEMSLSRADVVKDDGKTVTLNVHYVWRDTTYGSDDLLQGGGGGSGGCFGFDERQFVVARRDGGGWSVSKMSGAQRS